MTFTTFFWTVGSYNKGNSNKKYLLPLYFRNSLRIWTFTFLLQVVVFLCVFIIWVVISFVCLFLLFLEFIMWYLLVFRCYLLPSFFFCFLYPFWVFNYLFHWPYSRVYSYYWIIGTHITRVNFLSPPDLPNSFFTFSFFSSSSIWMYFI